MEERLGPPQSVTDPEPAKSFLPESGQSVPPTFEELVAFRSPRSSYNGDKVYRTTDCDECDFHLTMSDLETCEWGVAWKELIPRPKGERGCAKLNGPRPSPRMKTIIDARQYARGGGQRRLGESGQLIFSAEEIHSFIHPEPPAARQQKPPNVRIEDLPLFRGLFSTSQSD